MRRATPSVALLGGLGGLGLAVLYLTQPGRSVASAGADLEALLTGTLKLTAAQLAMADVITEEFAAAGLAWLTIGATANAYAESRLDPLAAGDHGHSIGLFQLSEYGAGQGMTVEQRQDPRQNCQRIIATAQSSGLLARSGLTNAQWASSFAELVERCAACAPGASEYVSRGALVAKLFGDQVAAQVPR